MIDFMEQRRIFERHPVRLRFGYTAPGREERVAFSGDVSAMGAHIVTGAPFTLGTLVRAETTLPDGSEVELEGEVVWAKRAPPHLVRQANAGFGIRITHASESWFQYCASLETSAPDEVEAEIVVEA